MTKLGSRKFLLLVALLIAATWLCYEGKLSGLEWVGLATLTVNGYVFANVMQKVKLNGTTVA